MNIPKNTLDSIQKLKTYKELTAIETIKAFDQINSNLYLIITTSGTILCRKKFDTSSTLSNVLIVADATIKLNSSHTINTPQLCIFVDQIVAFQPLDEQSYQELSAQL